MAKKIKLTKTQQKKLLRSWLGIIVILAVIGYNFYQQNKSIPTGERFEVTLDRCVDGDTAWFNVDGESTKVRFLYIDTPESTKEIEPYGKEASDYTKTQLTNAAKIELELNVDGDLLQEQIAREGLVEKFYDYGYDYTYKNEIIEAANSAKSMRKGIYSEN